MRPRTIIPSLDLANIADNLIAAFLDSLRGSFPVTNSASQPTYHRYTWSPGNFRNVTRPPSRPRDLSCPGRVFPFLAFQALCKSSNGTMSIFFFRSETGIQIHMLLSRVTLALATTHNRTRAPALEHGVGVRWWLNGIPGSRTIKVELLILKGSLSTHFLEKMRGTIAIDSSE